MWRNIPFYLRASVETFFSKQTFKEHHFFFISASDLPRRPATARGEHRLCVHARRGARMLTCCACTLLDALPHPPYLGILPRGRATACGEHRLCVHARGGARMLTCCACTLLKALPHPPYLGMLPRGWATARGEHRLSVNAPLIYGPVVKKSVQMSSKREIE